MSDLLSYALAYAKQGWEIFPLIPDTKAPIYPGGFHNATTDLEQIRRWWGVNPKANIGFVPCSANLVAIDLDPGHDPNVVPDSMAVKTPHGEHRYFRTAEKFSNAKLGPHIDVRSSNGYTILPPSVVDSVSYEWIDEDEASELPDEIRSQLHAKTKARREAADIIDSGDPGPALGWLRRQSPSIDGWIIACNLVRDFGLGVEKGIDVFEFWNDEQAVKTGWPWDGKKIEDLCNNAAKHGHGDARLARTINGSVYGEPPVGKEELYEREWFNMLLGSGLENIAEWWLKRSLPVPTQLCGPINSTSRVFLVAPTGLGKTHVAFAVALAVSTGTDWLHWHVPGPKRVLYIDGEMPRAMLQERLKEAWDRTGKIEMDGRMILVSMADYHDVPPFNEDSAFVSGMLIKHKPDLVIFDNVQALTNGDQKDTAPWRSMLKWMRSITDEGIAQLWVHHANETGGMYGDKTRAYQMDTVIELERSHEPGDISAMLKFTKHRELHPRQNKAAYRTGLVAIRDNNWVFVPEVSVQQSIIEAALEGEYGAGILTSELVKRMADKGDERTSQAVKKWLNRNRGELNRYIVAGITPIRWKLPYVSQKVSQDVSE